MKTNWIFTSAGFIMLILIIILVKMELFSGVVFFGMIFYIGIFLLGYVFIMAGKRLEQQQLSDEANRKNKFDWAWNRVNIILRRMVGNQGLEWDSGVGRESEFRSFFDGVMNRPFRSMLGFLSKSQQLVLIIYDIDRDDIARYIADPDPDLLDNHWRNFKPFARGSGSGMDEFGMFNQQYPGLHSRRYRQPITFNIGGDGMEQQGNQGPDDDMIDSALEKVRE